MGHLLVEVIQGVMFLMDLISILTSWRTVVCVIVAIPIALGVYLTSADREPESVIALGILGIGVVSGFIWDQAIEERQVRRRRRVR